VAPGSGPGARAGLLRSEETFPHALTRAPIWARRRDSSLAAAAYRLTVSLLLDPHCPAQVPARGGGTLRGRRDPGRRTGGGGARNGSWRDAERPSFDELRCSAERW
jgi:hypothetical protein